MALGCFDAGGQHLGTGLGDHPAGITESLPHVISKVSIECREIHLTAGTLRRLLRVHERFGGKEVGIHQAGEEHPGGKSEIEGELLPRGSENLWQSNRGCLKQFIRGAVPPVRNALGQSGLQTGPSGKAIEQPSVVASDGIGKQCAEGGWQHRHGVLRTRRGVIDFASDLTGMAVTARGGACPQVALEIVRKLAEIVPAAHQGRQHGPERRPLREGLGGKRLGALGHRLQVASLPQQSLPLLKRFWVVGVGMGKGCAGSHHDLSSVIDPCSLWQRPFRCVPC
ncbi:hypothetical protein Rifp1Sym_bj00010 [endosymbiont of Riftia pachyptila (vent Ph05)]|uniref:Uncharacterized protein n=1 Tax=endosymbiont of Riftia pachyptila (vent Ph05) TaxID=1048808 RepID=G2DD47_9GAMM|nr:hypothetical protein Rifp1Sym_bj00010 [endosymbiont of Riftia pachyptila (vent Ph05)]